MMKKITLLSAILLIAAQSYASVRVCRKLNGIQMEYQMNATLYFYGPQATETLAKKITDKINSDWNRPHSSLSKTPFASLPYYTPVTFQVTYEVVTFEEARKIASNNGNNVDANFIRLQHKTEKHDRSFMSKLFSNSGVWMVEDDLGNSTTTSHEFGHGLGLKHPKLIDQSHNGKPQIMAPRGSYVLSKYQWNPDAQRGSINGGTMSPYHRIVKFKENIVSLNLGSLDYDEYGCANLGEAQNHIYKLADDENNLVYYNYSK